MTTTSGNPARQRYNLLAFGSVGVGGVMAFVILLLLHHNFFTSLFVGLAWGLVPQGLAWGVAEIVAPGWVLKWRQRLIVDVTDWRKPVGDYFSERLVAVGSEPWRNEAAVKRVRVLGVGLTAFWLAMIALLVWVPPHLDAFYTILTRARK